MRLSLEHIVVSSEWQAIDRAPLQGLIMVIGAASTGKSTFARWLLSSLEAERTGPLAFLDGDPGQSNLGPPTTLTLAATKTGERNFPPSGSSWRWFVGSTTPRGHMLTHVIGIARLVQMARSRGIQTIVHDTTGLVNPVHGGLTLKLAKINLLEPDVVVAFQRASELEPLVRLLRRRKRVRLLELTCSPFVRSRDISERQRHRSSQFAQHFAGATCLEIDTSQFTVVGARALIPNQILAMEDSDGFALALGILKRPGRIATILTPIRDVSGVDILHLGDVSVDLSSESHT